MKSSPKPGAGAMGGVLFRPFRGAEGVGDHGGACPDCDWPLWMHDRERVTVPDTGGQWHWRWLCP